MYEINENTIFEKLHNNTFNNSFDDFSRCEDYWESVENGLPEILRFFQSALNVAIDMRDENKIQYCQKDNIISILESGHVVYSPYWIYRIKSEDKKCPICGGSFTIERQSISRRDNETLICSDCGINEAFNDYFLE